MQDKVANDGAPLDSAFFTSSPQIGTYSKGSTKIETYGRNSLIFKGRQQFLGARLL